MTGNEVSLYIHVPFCAKKCSYCHFFVLPDQERFKAQYLTSLFEEWDLRLPFLAGKQVVSIYFGGGTPSRLSAASIDAILSRITRDVSLASDCEITLEVNPEDATKSFFTSCKESGVNRLSFGIQSLDDTELVTLSRQHSAQQGMNALRLADAAGISNLSIDLMYDLPHQTLSSWETTLARVAEFPLTHLSLYNLTLEPHTVFFKQRQALTPHLPPPELSYELLTAALTRLPQLGLERYEISAFAIPGFASRHNSGYWTARPFLGFGPSAFSFWEHKRFCNIAHLNRYSERLKKGEFPIDYEEELSLSARQRELLAIQLRLVAGVDLSCFEAAQGKLDPGLSRTVSDLKNKGWLIQRGSSLQLTTEGQLFYDSVAVELI